MNNIKFKFWDPAGNKPLNKDNYLVDCDGVVVFMCNGEVFEVHDVIAIASTGLTDNDGGDIYYGDVYHVYGYGTLVIESLNDVMALMEAKAERDLGEKLGDIYNNPELKDAE